MIINIQIPRNVLGNYHYKMVESEITECFINEDEEDFLEVLYNKRYEASTLYKKILEFNVRPIVLRCHFQDGSSPLMKLLTYTYNDKSRLLAIEEFLRKGSAVNCQNDKGRTPLMVLYIETSYSDKLLEPVTELLLKYGADPNIVDNFGNTALMYIVLKYNTWQVENVIKILIAAGASIEIKNNEGRTISDMARDDELESLLGIKLMRNLSSSMDKWESYVLPKSFYTKFDIHDKYLDDNYLSEDSEDDEPVVYKEFVDLYARDTSSFVEGNENFNLLVGIIKNAPPLGKITVFSSNAFWSYDNLPKVGRIVKYPRILSSTANPKVILNSYDVFLHKNYVNAEGYEYLEEYKRLLNKYKSNVTVSKKELLNDIDYTYNTPIYQHGSDFGGIEVCPKPYKFVPLTVAKEELADDLEELGSLIISSNDNNILATSYGYHTFRDILTKVVQLYDKNLYFYHEDVEGRNIVTPKICCILVLSINKDYLHWDNDSFWEVIVAPSKYYVCGIKQTRYKKEGRKFILILLRQL